MTESSYRTGGCLCGRVRYTAPATPLTVTACHCRDCQRQSGGALTLLAVFPRDSVTIEGETSCYEGIGDSGRPVQRYFCGTCGSPIWSDSPIARERGIMIVKAGTLDEVDDLAPKLHFWTASKQPWLELGTGATPVERE